jgi:hypothetical protein
MSRWVRCTSPHLTLTLSAPKGGEGTVQVWGRPARTDQNSSPFFSMPWMPFSPFTVCVTWKSTASEQN